MQIPVQRPEAAVEGTAVRVPLLSYGFRVFFLLAAAYAVVAMAIWTADLAGRSIGALAMPPIAWHAHEMLIGFAGAGVAGFLLTAVPNWTGLPPLRGWPLVGLAGLWLAGRLAMIFGAGLSPALVALGDLSFLAVLVALSAKRIAGAGNLRNLPVAAIVGLLVVANALFHAPGFGLDAHLTGAGTRLAMHVLVLLIALIGGRIVPTFTGNWLKQTGRSEQPAPFGAFDKAVLTAAGLAAAADVWAPGSGWAGALLVAAGTLHAVRLGRWQGHRTGAEPLVWILHVGYLWVAVGSLLLGLSAWTEAVPRIAGVHALTVGAIGTMLLAVMSRASLGHTGRALTADPATVTVYGMVTLATLTRMAAAWSDGAWMALMTASAGAWIVAFGLFFIAYFKVWTGPRADAGRP